MLATRDPEVVDLLGWFGMTHELAAAGFVPYWRLAWLPAAGGVGDQDARLLEGLSLARAVSQQTLVEETRALRAWKAARRQTGPGEQD